MQPLQTVRLQRDVEDRETVLMRDGFHHSSRVVSNMLQASLSRIGQVASNFDDPIFNEEHVHPRLGDKIRAGCLRLNERNFVKAKVV